jgi:hypothetical protein
MRKRILVLVTSLASAAVIAVGTSAFAVAIAPPDVDGQPQNLPAIISGIWTPVEFDVTSGPAGSPVVVAGPVAEPIGQQAIEEPTTEKDSLGSDGESGDSGTETPEVPGGGSDDDVVTKDEADKAEKDKKDKAEKDKKDKAEKDKKDKAEKDKKDKAEKDKKDKAEKDKKDKIAKDKKHTDDEESTDQ